MNINNIRLKIKKLARDFNLNYNPKWFDYIILSRKENEIIKFILGCPAPGYNAFGIYQYQRKKNINLFIGSDEFKILSKNYGGQVIRKSGLQMINKYALLIKDKELKDSLKKSIQKIKIKFKKLEEIGISYIAAITKTNSAKEKKEIIKIVLRHEWIHTLLFKNSIEFKDKRYNEGLVTYLEGFLDNDLDKFIKIESSIKDQFLKEYYTYALKFMVLLKRPKTPTKRKEAICNLLLIKKPLKP